jgi:hypothetical protein
MREFNISITLTFSKIMAAIIFIGSFVMDFMNDKNGTVFMFALPFVVFLITGKQYFDKNKPEA